MYVRMYICMYLCMYLRMYLCIYVCTRVCSICIHIQVCIVVCLSVIMCMHAFALSVFSVCSISVRMCMSVHNQPNYAHKRLLSYQLQHQNRRTKRSAKLHNMPRYLLILCCSAVRTMTVNWQPSPRVLPHCKHVFKTSNSGLEISCY